MRLIAKNKKAFFNYEILETFEAGVALVGSEVKSIREGRISLKESYAEIKEGEVFLVSCHVSPYEAANRFNHDPLRDRKLLLHRREIKRLTGKIKERGLTLVPTKVLINDKGKVKIELALAKGKRTYQKREAIRERDRDREMQAELKRWR
jgi:SsrA-binding protein